MLMLKKNRKKMNSYEMSTSNIADGAMHKWYIISLMCHYFCYLYDVF